MFYWSTIFESFKYAEMPGVVSVFPNMKRSLHTTHSWDFMGLVSDEDMEISGLSTKNQEDVIIGVIDTGRGLSYASFAAFYYMHFNICSVHQPTVLR